MTTDKELHLLLDSVPQTQRQRVEWTARLGDNEGNLFVTNPDGTRKDGYVWATVDPLGVLAVRCRKVTEKLGWPVRIGKSSVDGVLEVIEEDPEQAIHFSGSWGGNVPPHRKSHQFMGSDPDFVEGLRYRPLLTTPTNPASLSVYLEPYIYTYQGTQYYWPGGEIDLTAEVPSNPSEQILIVTYLDPATNTASYVAGTDVVPFVPGATGIPFTGDDVVAIDTAGYLPSVALRLYYGQTEIVWTDYVADVRNQFLADISPIDDFLYKPGVSGGQTASGGTDAGDDLILNSTTNGTKGTVQLAAGLVYIDEANGLVGINESTVGAQLHVKTATVSNVGLIIQTSDDDDTNNITEWQSSADAVLSYVDYTGNVKVNQFLGVGTDPLASGSTLAPIYILYSSTQTSGALNGVRSNMFANPGSASSANYIAQNFTVSTVNANAQNITGGLYGVSGIASHNGSGTLAGAYGTLMQVGFGAAAVGGVITNAYGMNLSFFNVGSGCTFGSKYHLYLSADTAADATAKYGLFIGNISGGGSNYAMLTNAGKIIINVGGDAATTFSVRGDTDPYLLHTYAAANNVGIGVSDPDTKLEILHAGNQLKLSFDGTDNATFGVDTNGDLTITASGDEILVADWVRHTASSYRRYYHLPITSFDPGASGATWVSADANTLSGWGLDAAGETLEFNSDVHADWDEATDLNVEITFTVNVDNSGGGAGDTVDLQLICYYKGEGDEATKSQTLEDAIVVGACNQWTQFNHEFTINYDEVDNVVEVGDRMSFTLNLETDTSEVDDITINDGSFYYQTTHLGTESGDT